MTFLMKHYGNLYESKVIYLYTSGVNSKTTIGFFALIRSVLDFLRCSSQLGFIPVIFWGENNTYYDMDLDYLTKNAFEYYYEPVSSISYQDVMQCKNVVEARVTQYTLRGDGGFYSIKDNFLFDYANLYNKHLHLNGRTKTYLEKELKCHFPGGRTLGVHFRGTDFKQNLVKHPRYISPDEYLRKTVEIVEKGRYDRVFLATDDSDALEMYMNTFKSKLIYFDDVIRTNGLIGTHLNDNQRKYNHYLMGLEVLRDVYALACCDSLIGGMSNVTSAARYINRSLGKAFEYVDILGSELNINGRGRRHILVHE